MSGFWLGVFSALAVWELISVLLGLALYGDTREVDEGTIGAAFFLMVVFMAAAWYVQLGF